MSRLAMTFFPSLHDAQGKRHASSWPALCRWLSSPIISAVKQVAGFSVATYAGDRRAKANVEFVHAVGLDLDHGVSLSDLRQRFVASSAMVHTTWSSTLLEPRARVFLELSRPVSGEEYSRVYRAVAEKVEAGGLEVDRAASDPSRFWFRPSVPKLGSPFVYWTCEGAPVDVDAALEAVPPPAPLPPPAPRPLASGGASAFDRARAYVAKAEPAIQGSGGRTTTFMLAQRLVRGFDLPIPDALVLLADWNQRCVPPWSERDLRAKCEEAAKSGRFQVGELLARVRER